MWKGLLDDSASSPLVFSICVSTSALGSPSERQGRSLVRQIFIKLYWPRLGHSHKAFVASFPSFVTSKKIFKNIFELQSNWFYIGKDWIRLYRLSKVLCSLCVCARVWCLCAWVLLYVCVCMHVFAHVYAYVCACVCSCVCVCTCVLVCAYVCVYPHTWGQKLIFGVFLHYSPPWFLRQGPSLTWLTDECPELTDSDKLSCHLHLPSSWMTNTHTHIFYVGSGDSNSGPHVCAKLFPTPQTISLVPASNQFLTCLLIKMPKVTACPLSLKYLI